MAFIFTMNGKSKTRTLVDRENGRLSTIIEGSPNPDAANVPPVPRRSSLREAPRAFLAGTPLSLKFTGQRPELYDFEDVVGPTGEKLSELRERRSTRGGWKRLIIILVVVALCLVGLIVGVVVGTNKKQGSKSSSNPSGSTASSGGTSSGTSSGGSGSGTPSKFPAGKYSFVTFLDTVVDSCSPNPDLWNCYPYIVYNDNHDKAQSVFTWEITSPSTDKYSISSAPNPFAPNFTNIDLQLLDKGSDNERFTFSFQSTRLVIPQHTNVDNQKLECHYPETTFRASIYTKMTRTYPTTNSTIPASTDTFQPWPFFVAVEQSAGSGTDVPMCYKFANGKEGDMVQIAATQNATSLCSCIYRNRIG